LDSKEHGIPKAKLLPPKTKETLIGLVSRRNELQAALDATNGAINAAMSIARELLDVPDDWVIGEIEKGFMPPPPIPQQPTQDVPSHE